MAASSSPRAPRAHGIPHSLYAQQAPLLEVCDDVLAGRARRSLLEPDLDDSITRTLRLSTFDYAPYSVEMDLDGPHTSKHTLEVMLTDGTKRPARSIFEWLQQFCVEQVTLRTALRKRGIGVPPVGSSNAEMPCLLAYADDFEVPQMFNRVCARSVLKCADWWTMWMCFEKEENEAEETKKKVGCVVVRKPPYVPRAKTALLACTMAGVLQPCVLSRFVES